MYIGFTESSYAFAVVHELVWRLREVVGVPVFPSLRLEGREGGYDVSLVTEGRSVFLQFKAGERLVRRSAREWALFGSPFYRFWIYPPRRSLQHDLLLRLEDEFPLTFYVAPVFSDFDEFDRVFAEGRVVLTSIAIQPREIGELPDDDYHCVSYTALGEPWFFLSDPHTGPVATARPLAERLAEGLEEATDTQRVAFTDQYFRDLKRVLVGLIREQGLAAPLALELGDDREACAAILRAFFGCELLLVGSRA